MHFFATAPRGLELVLASELQALGAESVEERIAGAAFAGPLEAGYRACMWSRSASRILAELVRFPAPDPEALYQGAFEFDWAEHLDSKLTFAVGFTSARSAITHTNFGALKVKDAIADRFRERTGERPSVDRSSPDVQVYVHIHDDVATLGIDLSGERLHRRAWRRMAGAAPLKETLAAGLLLLADWPGVSEAGGGLVDPMCGAGTLPVEAALMALDVAPGLLRSRFGFEKWKQHRPELLAALLAEAKERDLRGRGGALPIVGCDNDPRTVRVARANARSAGVAHAVRFHRRELAMVEPEGDAPGVFITNPPYGERLGSPAALKLLYQRLGMTLKHRFHRWTGYVFTGNRELAGKVGLKAARRHELYNGAIECRLYRYPMLPPKEDSDKASPGEMFANRLGKNMKKLRKWVAREGVSCYRAYDADLPEYAITVDVYGERVHVQENQRPDTVDPLKAETRLHDALAGIAKVMGIGPERIYVKHRKRQRGSSQYDKAGDAGETVTVEEGGLKFLVNLVDYFDAGLFLDHRPIRKMLGELAAGRRFLNLFAYTGSATVHAAAGGAKSTTTVDLSRTYLDWAGQNLALNGFSGQQHRLVAEDVLQWIQRERGRYGLIFLDPPTFSNSKAMKRDFDVQRDHVRLITQVVRLLEPDGVLIFSNNFRRFKMDFHPLRALSIEEITKATIPPDFARNQRIHNAWRIVQG